MKLSVALATYNEQENIERCLSSVKDIVDEIVVVDGSSTDKTVDVVRKFTNKITIVDNPPIFHINKQKAIDGCEGDWILQLDADEVISQELGKEIKRVLNSNCEFSAFWIKRKNFFLGRWLSRGGQYPDPVIRFFRRGKAYLPCKSVHEQMVVDGKIGWLKNDLLHYSVPTFSRYLVNSNRYTSLTASEFLEKKIKINFFNSVNYFLVKPFWELFRIYFRHKGFVDGFPGLVFALFSGLHFPVAYIKYWELTKNIKK